MTDAELDATWQRYWRDRSDEDRNGLAVHYLRLAYHWALRYYQECDADERRSAAHWLLLRYVAEYDRARGKSFEQFLCARLRWDLRDHFYKNKDRPDRLGTRLHRHSVHDDMPARGGITAIDSAALSMAVEAATPQERQIVLRSIVGGERMKDLAAEFGCCPEAMTCKRKAALLVMRTGGRVVCPWHQFRTAALRAALGIGNG